ncbi:MAG: MerR family DNA-binding transcriptional regulator [bacterium]|nr:MerR family DNA-binding transcriptional regulator [bacterium]
MDDKELARFINIKGAAKLLGVSPLTLRNWDKKQKLVAYRHPINNYRVYRRDEIENFLQKIETHNKPKKIEIRVLEE